MNKTYSSPVIKLEFVLNKLTLVGKNLVRDKIEALDNLETNFPTMFSDLVPMQHFEMYNNFKSLVIDQFKEMTRFYLSEKEIKINSNKLKENASTEINKLISSTILQEGIPEYSELYVKIKMVKDKGGEKRLRELLLLISKRQDQILSKYSEFLNMIKYEEIEDNNLREKFRNNEKLSIIGLNVDEMLRQKSSDLNSKIIKAIDENISVLKLAKSKDDELIRKIEHSLQNPRDKNEAIITILSTKNFSEINKMFNCNEMKDEMIKKLEMIDEYVIIQKSYKEYENLFNKLIELKSELFEKIISLVDGIDLSSVNKDNFYEKSKYFMNEIYNNNRIKEYFTKMDQYNKNVKLQEEEVSKYNNELIRIFEDMKIKYKESDTNSFGNKEKIIADIISTSEKSLMRDMLNFKSEDKTVLKDKIEASCDSFIEIDKLIRYNEEFYLIQLNKQKNIEFSLVKWLIERYTAKDSFIHQVNSQKKCVQMGLSDRVNRLYSILNELQIGFTHSYGNNETDIISNLNINS